MKSRLNFSKTKESIKFTADKQIILIATLIIILFGVTIMLINRYTKQISFNNRIIQEQNLSIVEYGNLIKNVGICPDLNRDGKYDKNELNKCDPNTVNAEDVRSSLRYNIMHEIAQNPDLESVGRESLSLCYNSDGKRIDFFNKQRESISEKEKLLYIDLTKKCSAIRVIPEALPSKKNTEALLASLNKIMLVSNWQPERISPDGEVVKVDIPGLDFMPLKFSVEAQPETIYSIVENIEKSIRNIDINRANISWGGKGKIEFSANSTAYYAENEQYQDKTINIRQTDAPKSKSKGKTNTKKGKR